MSRIPQPREVAELRGHVKHNPQRYQNEVPKSAQPIGEAPEHLSDEVKAVWFELVCLAIPNVLTGADRLTVELAATLVAEFREAPKEFTGSKIGHLRGVLASLGMSPADRQKLSVDKPKENDFSEFS